jgi:hypothetical protein
MKQASHQHCNDEHSRGRRIRAAAQRRGVAERRLRKRTQTEKPDGFSATVMKGVYGGVRKAATAHVAPASIWQNQAKNINDFNVDIILAPRLPFHSQML